MMRRRIFLWMGLGVLFTTLFLCRNALAVETYTVQSGDSLYRIALNHGVSLNALKESNHLKSSRLRPHQTLIIPARPHRASIKSKSAPVPQAESVTVRKGDTLIAISRRTGIPVSVIRELNQIRGSALKAGQRLVLKEPVPDEAPEASNETKLQSPEAGEQQEEAENALFPEAQASADAAGQDCSDLLGQWNSPEEQKLLVKVAKGFLGAPYRLGGSSVTGIDCSGFVKKIYQFFNIELPRTAFEQSRIGMRVSRDELAEGDLIFFNTRKYIGHVGIYIGNNEFVHACSRKKGVRVDNLNTPYYDRRFCRAVRLKGNDSSL